MANNVEKIFLCLIRRLGSIQVLLIRNNEVVCEFDIEGNRGTATLNICLPFFKGDSSWHLACSNITTNSERDLL